MCSGIFMRGWWADKQSEDWLWVFRKEGCCPVVMEVTWEQPEKLKKNIKSFIKFWKLHILCADGFDCLCVYMSDQPPYILTCLGMSRISTLFWEMGRGKKGKKYYSSLSSNSSAVLGNHWDSACPSPTATTILCKKFLSIMGKQKAQEVGHYLDGFSLMAKI